MTWQIWLAIASIVFIVFGLVKRLETRMLLIVAGFILCCASGAPMKAFGAFVVRPAAHMCLCGESPLSARTGEGLATRQVGEGNDFDGGSR